MVIFLNLDGTANVVVPERMFQGSTLNSITVISAYPSTTAMQIAFFLPSGTATSYAPMHFNLASSVERAGVWSYALPFAVLQNVGVVGVAIMATLLSGNQTSYTCDFKVEESVLPTLPPQPTADIYQLILQYLAQDQSSIVNLDIRVGDLENVIVKRTMIDFTAVSDGTIATFTKHYSDATTAVFSMPISGGAPVTASGLVIVTFSASSWRDTGTMLAPSGVFELAFANTQIGQLNADYIVSVAKVDSHSYEVASETVPSVKNGYSTLSDKVFKGSDGSALISTTIPYDGQLICYNGRVSGKKDFVVGISLELDMTSLVVSYLDGSSETIGFNVYTKQEVDRLVNNIGTSNIVDGAITTPKIVDNSVTIKKLSEEIQTKLSTGGKTGTSISYLASDWRGTVPPYTIVIPQADYNVLASGKFAQFSDNLVFGFERTNVGITLTSSVKRDFTIFIK